MGGGSWVSGADEFPIQHIQKQSLQHSPLQQSQFSTGGMDSRIRRSTRYSQGPPFEQEKIKLTRGEESYRRWDKKGEAAITFYVSES
jgi:hypothetical protein